MSLNFLGMGFSFGAKDTGLSKAQTQYAKGFNSMSDSAGKLDGILSGIRLNNIIDSFSLMRLNDIHRGLRSLAEDGGNLTTSFEATMHQNYKTTRQMAANFGYTGKELKKFSSQAQSMNLSIGVGVEEAGAAIKNFGLVNKSTWKALGVEGVEDLAKAADVFKIDVSEMRSNLQTMTGVLGMNDTQVGAVISSYQEMGSQLGDVGTAMKSLPKILDKLQRKATLMGKSLDPEQLAKLAKETAAASAGFFNMGFGAEEAQSMAEAMIESTISGQENIANIFAGTESDLGKLLEGLSIAGGDINSAFELMREGPSGFLKGFNSLVKSSGRDSAYLMNLMRGQIEQAFGKEGAQGIMAMVTRGSDASFNAMAKVETATKSLGKATKEAYVDQRTFADRHQLIEDLFLTRLRNIGSEGGSLQSKFLKRSKEAHNAFASTVESLVKKGGPLGKMAEKMAEIHILGAKALLPDALLPMADVFGSLAKEAAPFAMLLSAMWPMIAAIASPIGLLVIGLGAVAARIGWLMAEGKTFGEALGVLGDDIEGVLKTVGEFAQKGAAMFMKWFNSVDWVAVGNQVKEGVLSTLQTLGVALKSVLPVVVKGLLNTVWWTVSELPGLLLTAIPDILGFVVPLLNGLTEMVVGALGTVVDTITNFLAEKFPESAATIFAVGEGIKNYFTFMKDVLTQTFTVMGKVLGGLATGIKIAFVPTITFIWNLLKGLGSFVSDFFGGLFTLVTSPLVAMFDIGMASVDLLTNGFVNFGTFLGEFFAGIVTMFSDPMLGIQMIGQSVVNFLIATWDGFKTFFFDIWDALLGFSKNASDGLLSFILSPVESIVSVWSSLLKFFDDLWESVAEASTKGLSPITAMVDTLKGLFGGDGIAKEVAAKALPAANKVVSDVSKSLDQATAKANAVAPTIARPNVSKPRGADASKLPGTAEPKTAVSAKAALKEAGSGDAMERLVAATNAPAWYHNDFRPLFVETMTSMHKDSMAALGNVASAMAPKKDGADRVRENTKKSGGAPVGTAANRATNGK